MGPGNKDPGLVSMIGTWEQGPWSTEYDDTWTQEPRFTEYDLTLGAWILAYIAKKVFAIQNTFFLGISQTFSRKRWEKILKTSLKTFT